MTWQVGLVACAVLAVAFLAIAGTIAISLGRSGQLRSNHLGRATAVILAICGIWPLGLVVLMALPSLGVDSTLGLAIRVVFDGPMAIFSVFAASAVAGYWWMWWHNMSAH